MNNNQETKKIDKYHFQLSSVLGQGSFGKVFKGKNTENGQLVAIKMIEKKQIQNDEYLMNGLFSEIQIMKKLKSEYVVDLIDVLETSNNYYIIQEYCDGGDFRSELKKRKNLSEQESLNVMKDLLNGFMDLLKNGIIHRDLKPENILIKGNQHKLADFGFARTVDNFQRQMLTSLVGTPLYMSPQILMHEKYTAKSDLWSLAFIFYEMLYGKTPYTANSQYQLVKNIQTKPLEFDPAYNVSDLSKDFITRCLKIDEKDRMEWTDVYKHPVFQGYFQKFTSQFDQMEDKAKYIINELRQNIYKNRIDLEDLFKKYDFSHDSKLEMKEFSKLMKSIDNTLDRSEIEYIFNKFDDDKDNTISFEEFTKWLSNNDVVMSTKMNAQVPTTQAITRQNTQTGTNLVSNSGNNSPASQQAPMPIQQKQSGFAQNFLNNQNQNLSHSRRESVERANYAIKKLQFAIQKYNINLGDLFSKYDKSDDKQLDISEFSKLLKKVDPDLTEEELNCTFTIFDKNGDQSITFNEFFETLQEISYYSLQQQRVQQQQQFVHPNQQHISYSQQQQKYPPQVQQPYYPQGQPNQYYPYQPPPQNGGVIPMVPPNNFQNNMSNHSQQQQFPPQYNNNYYDQR
ncbi:Serine/Threonine kinase domain protein (macronuclear) [Tetrahymena thermophila SB210]|uniref:Serine/Threonine kinase domain protein n=1 Tax=Tetrahymena thermophila (strain SB210) TaxID=312017 RepID=Q24DL4_TETTS|nr:Serine/Threonine kinase domain protein [Tetrahymena thermophila SB210]EAS05834.2 Serine/Threonine kinase domain protein [Tetrahymena thermophila SB210]|eukprot:XP_001026079.2 Serine/Threonine kinase domain protein [Tetrahymena thermophila SB210]